MGGGRRETLMFRSLSDVGNPIGFRKIQLIREWSTRRLHVPELDLLCFLFFLLEISKLLSTNIKVPQPGPPSPPWPCPAHALAGTLDYAGVVLGA